MLLLRHHLILIFRYLNIAFIEVHINCCIVIINDADVGRGAYRSSRPHGLAIWRSALLILLRVIVLVISILVWIWIISPLVGVSFLVLLSLSFQLTGFISLWFRLGRRGRVPLFIIGWSSLIVKLVLGFVYSWHFILHKLIHLIYILKYVLMVVALFWNSSLLQVGRWHLVIAITNFT